MKSTGLGDTAFFGPEPEFFVFDSVRWGADMSGSFCSIASRKKPAWNTGKDYEHGNKGFRPTVKGGYFPVPPVDSGQEHALGDVPDPGKPRHSGRSAPPTKSPTPATMEIGTRFSTLIERADWVPAAEVRHPQRGWRLRQDPPTFMPKPIVGDNGSGMHVHHVGLERRQEPVRRRRLCRPCRNSRCTTSAASSSTPARSERDHQTPAPTATSAWSRANEAPVKLAYSAQRTRSALDPHSVRREPEGAAASKRVSRIR